MSIIKMPSEGACDVALIGGVKAVHGGFLVLDKVSGEILVYAEVPTDVAVAWRADLVRLLSNHRPGRPVKQLEWLEIAAGVDSKWATENGWTAPAANAAPVPAAAAPPATTASAPTPARRTSGPTAVAAE